MTKAKETKTKETTIDEALLAAKKGRGGVRPAVLAIVAALLAIAALFGYFYISLHGWEAVPFAEHVPFLPSENQS